MPRVKRLHPCKWNPRDYSDQFLTAHCGRGIKLTLAREGAKIVCYVQGRSKGEHRWSLLGAKTIDAGRLGTGSAACVHYAQSALWDRFRRSGLAGLKKRKSRRSR